ncbi:unnamed protein product [Closterium sp. NIES-65]|nr:unnamed protein product [Closterium sp. NIES-65]CAI6000365.1 unnamed protein product [Closterium sp. NIES-65]
MLHDAHMDRGWWGEAALTAAYLRNHAISRGGSASKTPIELWTGARPDVSHLRIFGSPVSVLVPPQRRSKLDDRSTAGVMVGPNLPSLSFTSHDLFHHPPPPISKSASTSNLFSSSFVFQSSSALDAARLPPSIPLLSFFSSSSPLHL